MRSRTTASPRAAAPSPPARSNPRRTSAPRPTIPATATPSAPEPVSSAPPAAVLIVGGDQRIRHAEGTAFDQHHVDAAAYTGRTLREALPAETLPILLPYYEEALAGAGQSFAYQTHDGAREYWVQMAPIPDGAGAVSMVVVVMHDITEPRRVAAELARSRARLQEAERMVGVGSWELSFATDEITFSPGLARLLGLSEGERLTGASHLDLVHPEDRDIVAAVGEACWRHGSVTCEYRVIGADGSIRTVSLHAELVPGAAGDPGSMRGAVLDITEQRAAERERRAAEHLFRQGFDASPVGMILSDPVEGRCVRVNDALCRLLQRSQEELLGATVELIIHPDETGAVRAARQQMLAGSSSSYQAEHRFVRADGSVGWGLLHITPVRHPDGSAQAFHSQFVDITARKEREERLEHGVNDALWLGRIRDALDEDRFILYSQPIVDLVTGETVQHELLLRMRGEDGSIIAPGEFLPAAERYGLISEIDRWVIRQAVEAAAQGTPTEFNLSGRSIGDPAIIRELAGAIADTGVDPSLLVVEVTETALADRTEAGHEFAERVRQLGCRVALDDFGTGFSSLSYLKRFPADHLKIDIEFVRELTCSETDVRVVRGIVGLAREFGQTTIAEGVEDEATLLILKELGVEQAQGYLFGAPAPRGGGPSPSRAVRRAVSAGSRDPICIVREAFDAFADRDLPGMLAHCCPDVVLRPLTTARLADRNDPYRGHDGVRTYLADVERVWDDLSLTPLSFRQTDEAVIGFGRVEGRQPGSRIIASILWIVRLQEDQIASIEVFQAAGEDALSPAQLERLAQSGRTTQAE